MPSKNVHLPFSNLRELGGYPTTDGRTIKRGVLYRCGHMDELSQEQVETYQALNLRTIIDLRRDDEVTDRPTPQFGEEKNIHISVSDPENTFSEAAARVNEPNAAQLILAGAATYYSEIITKNIHRYVPVMELIFSPDSLPVLFHCTAGKDRTGFVAAAVLKFLDVSDEIVFEDYLLTNEVLGERANERVALWRERLAAKHGFEESEVEEESLNALRTLMLTHYDMINATFTAVTETFGTWHNLRREAFGITDEALEAFRENVLE